MDAEKGRAPNIRDVAREAGVSYQTVSRVLNDSTAIRPATREQVLRVIEELGYRPNPAARALVTTPTTTSRRPTSWCPMQTATRRLTSSLVAPPRPIYWR